MCFKRNVRGKHQCRALTDSRSLPFAYKNARVPATKYVPTRAREIESFSTGTELTLFVRRKMQPATRAAETIDPRI